MELGNLLEYFKTKFLGTLSSQLDTLKLKKKQEEENATLVIFCHQHRKKNPSKDCPLNNVRVCDNVQMMIITQGYPFLLGLQEIYAEGNEQVGLSVTTPG